MQRPSGGRSCRVVAARSTTRRGRVRRRARSAARTGRRGCPRVSPRGPVAGRAAESTLLLGTISVPTPIRVQQGASMPTYQSPGVFVEEAPSGARPLEGVGTAVAAFIGLAEDGPFNAPDPGEQLDPVHDHLRRLRARFLPGPVGLRLLHERRRQLLRRPHRAERLGRRAGTARRPGQGAGRGADRADRPAQGQRARPGGAARRGQRRGHPGRAATARATTCSGSWSSATARWWRSSTGPPSAAASRTS